MTGQAAFALEAVFATPIVIADVVDSAALNAALEEAILARRATDPGIARTNIGGWHSRPDFTAWGGDAGASVIRHAVELADRHTRDTNPPPSGRRGWTLDAWANVIEGSGAHEPHIHPGAYWSAVYYVRVDPGEGGQLIFHDPRGATPQMHAPDLRMAGVAGERQVDWTPVAGKLVLFPSWLSHAVAPYRGAGRRISVAINLAAPK